eukprot:1161867-Pelagomonas_calceolata.AAC.2
MHVSEKIVKLSKSPVRRWDLPERRVMPRYRVVGTHQGGGRRYMTGIQLRLRPRGKAKSP